MWGLYTLGQPETAGYYIYANVKDTRHGTSMPVRAREPDNRDSSDRA